LRLIEDITREGDVQRKAHRRRHVPRRLPGQFLVKKEDCSVFQSQLAGIVEPDLDWLGPESIHPTRQSLASKGHLTSLIGDPENPSDILLAHSKFDAGYVRLNALT
jgi:hypothetical protein